MKGEKLDGRYVLVKFKKAERITGFSLRRVIEMEKIHIGTMAGAMISG